jgi:surfeit locus 1 family protein
MTPVPLGPDAQLMPIPAQAPRPARRGWIWVAALLSVGLTVSLGCWQLRRAEQKRMAWAELQSRQHLPAWGNADWPCRLATPASSGQGQVPTPAPELPQQRPAQLTGHWLASRTVYLDNRPMDGASGFIVVTPLRLVNSGAACAGGIVLVQRGWVPRNAQDRLHVPPVPTPAGQVQVVGRVLSGLSQAYQLGDEVTRPDAHAPVIRQNAAPVFWSAWLGQAPLVGAVLQVQDEQVTEAPMATASEASPPVLRRHWPEPGQGQDKHLAYAAQWFAMAGVITALTVWHQILRPRRFIQPRPHDHV